MAVQKVVLIDDDVEDHEIFMIALGEVSQAAECTAFTNALDALEALNAKRLNPDIIFLDLNMPIMTGQEFLIEAKKNNEIKHIPIVIFSTSANPGTIKLTKELGARDFITKPDRFDKLIDMLKPIIQ